MRSSVGGSWWISASTSVPRLLLPSPPLVGLAAPDTELVEPTPEHEHDRVMAALSEALA